MRFYLLLVGLMFGELSLSSSAFATISINLSGTSQTSTANLEKSKGGSVTANIGLSLGQYFSIGVTHRRAFSDDEGLKKGRNADATAYLYIPFRERTETITNSVDLTIIPYTGIVSPFLFGGVARRDYYNQFDFQGTRTTSTQTLYPVPNYGLGLAIQLGAGFQLKVTQTFSPGKETTVDDANVEKVKEVRDTYTEFGLGYKI